MVNDDTLASTLSDFARTVLPDFPIQAILDHLVERIPRLLPVTSAGATLVSAGIVPSCVAASNDVARGLETLQNELSEGPCRVAYQTGEREAVVDLASDDRFPRFAPAAVAAGALAEFSFPLRHGDKRLGVLDLYRDTAGSLDPHDLDAAQMLADVAAAYVLNAQAREEARATLDRVHHAALHDALTGLPNRLLLQERLEHAARRAQRSHTQTALFFIDLDHFKRVNDTHGHRTGDELLMAAATRLTGLIRSGDTLARFAGDEFVILCEELHHKADVNILAGRIVQALARPFQIDGKELRLTASVGIAFAGTDPASLHQLVTGADSAMYRVKRAGGDGHQMIDLRSTSSPHADTTFAGELEAALDRQELDVAYQPIVRTADGCVVGLEALVRWTHPTRGALTAASIIAAAEQTRMIARLGSWVLEQSCRAHCKWTREQRVATLDLAVNVSPRQLVDPAFSADVERVLRDAEMDPRALILEVDESIFLEDSTGTSRIIEDLKRRGIRFALDGFGSGRSSLGYLRRLPIDIVKIDNASIAEVATVAGTGIVEAITNLAHVLGLVVVAKGVETAEQRAQLAAVGCDRAQGLLFAAPLPSSAVSSVLVDRAPPRAAP